MISLSSEMIEFIDNVCTDFNQKLDGEKPLTRSRFISLCVLDYYMRAQAEAQTKPTESVN